MVKINKSNISQTVTKNDLNKLATKADIQILEKDIGEKMLDLREGIIDQAYTRMTRDKDELKDEIMTGIDKVMKELQDMREENAAGTLQIRRLDEKVEDHEKRITHLESSPRGA